MSPYTLAWISLSVGGWALANGILHDIEVIRGHYTEYDRHFLYYLLNGHIIMFSGIFEMISYAPISNGQVWGLVVSGTAVLGMIVYCAMIWKFLPSFLTIVLQSGLLIALVLHYFRILLRRSMVIPWIVIVVLALSLGITFIGRRLIRTSRLSKPWNIAAWIGLILFFVLPIASMALIRRSGGTLLLLSWITYVGLGFISFVFFLLLLRDVLWFLVWIGRRISSLVSGKNIDPDPSRRQFLLQSMNLGVIGAAALATSYGIYEARKTPGLVELDIPIPRLPQAFDGFRIVQICDIHAGLTVDRDWIEAVVEEVQKQSPDLIAFVGDMVDGSVPGLESTVAPFADLRAPYGKFFTTGNHEYYSGANPWIDHARVLGFDVLMNEHRKIEKNGSTIILTGVTDYSAGQFYKDQASDPHKAVAGAADDHVKILMAHQPRSLYQFGDLKIDFTMHGHTHGGQFIPWNLLATLGQPFIKGLHRWNDGLVYVSKGTGYWGPPVRLGARSEVTVFTLRNV